MTRLRVPVSRILLPENVVAGCNYLVIASFTYMLRSTREDPDPVLVRPVGDGLFRVSDGRHRFLAAVIAGRNDVLCELEEAP